MLSHSIMVPFNILKVIRWKIRKYNMRQLKKIEKTEVNNYTISFKYKFPENDGEMHLTNKSLTIKRRGRKKSSGDCKWWNSPLSNVQINIRKIAENCSNQNHIWFPLKTGLLWKSDFHHHLPRVSGFRFQENKTFVENSAKWSDYPGPLPASDC